MTGSTLARRSLGRELRRLREAKGMSQTAAGRVVELSPQSIGRIEDGQSTRVSSLQINALCDAYGATGAERRTLLALAREMREASKSGGRWWRAYADQIPGDFDHFVSLEEVARRITTSQMSLLPGLLQIPEYRREGEWTMHPQATPEEVERRIDIATRRQHRLQDDDFEYSVFLSEAVLNHQIGGPAVMARQLRHLTELAQLPNISIRVIPNSVGSHVGLHVGSFVMFEFPALAATRAPEPPVVYVEGYTGDLYLERDSEITPYRNALAELDRVALDVGESTRLIADKAREYEG
ncbi:helix-turn-helix domain-containing protein [Nocardia terpenica]|uniref:Helix-turn-helix domain-containing protein n=1 Tax=Nocardia terpenica TaxID=455432 RepID=A0A6G9Z4F3_9NOCA|nr:helix-turn-helix transcriptional regulator [Nocardia terpenica]QIS20485.1 helix-turn-helix domain-containing protein [Nocardia terpenica]